MSCFQLPRPEYLALSAFIAAHASGNSRIWYYQPDRPTEQNYYDAHRIATILQTQNAAAVATRYSEDMEDLKAICPREADAVAMPDLATVVKTLRDIDYNCDESPDWLTSEARELLHAVRVLALDVAVGVR